MALPAERAQVSLEAGLAVLGSADMQSGYKQNSQLAIYHPLHHLASCLKGY